MYSAPEVAGSVCSWATFLDSPRLGKTEAWFEVVGLLSPPHTWLGFKPLAKADPLPFFSREPKMNLAWRPINEKHDQNLEGLECSGEKYCFFHNLKKCFYYLPQDKFQLFTL